VLLLLPAVADRPFEPPGAEVPFFQEVGGPGPHRPDVDGAIAQAGQQDHRRGAAAGDGRVDQPEAVEPSQAVVDQVEVVPTPRHFFQPGFGIGEPVEHEPDVRDVGQQVARQNVIVLVVVDQQKT